MPVIAFTRQLEAVVRLGGNSLLTLMCEKEQTNYSPGPDCYQGKQLKERNPFTCKGSAGDAGLLRYSQ